MMDKDHSPHSMRRICGLLSAKSKYSPQKMRRIDGLFTAPSNAVARPLQDRENPVAEEGKLLRIVDEGKRDAGVALSGDRHHLLGDLLRRSDEGIAARPAGEALTVAFI